MSFLRRQLRLILLLTVTVSLGAAWVVLEVNNKIAQQELFESRTRLRALGIPLTHEEYLATIQPAGPDDPAPLYEEAARLIEASTLKAPVEFNAREAWLKQGKREEMTRALIDAYQLVAEASRRPRLAYSVEQFEGIRSSEAQDNLQHLCYGQAEIANQRGDWAGALGALRVANDVARHFYIPSLSGYRELMYSQDAVLVEFGKLIEGHATSPQFVEAARTWFDELPMDITYRESFVGDVHDMISRSRSTSWCGVVPEPTFLDLFTKNRGDFIYTKTTRGRAETETQVLDYVYELVTAPQHPPTLMKLRQDIGTRLRADTSTKGFLVKRAMYGLGYDSDELPFTQRRVLDAALWLLEKRLATGVVPTDWPADQRFMDPWTGQPLHLEVTPAKLTVRSCGPNAVSDAYDDVEISVPLNPKSKIETPKSRAAPDSGAT